MSAVTERLEPPRAAEAPSTISRVYGLGSVFGKTLRDSTRALVAVATLLSLVVVVTLVAIADQFATAEARAALAREMEALPALFQGLLGKPIEIETLPGFLSWRLVGALPLMVGLWSITALAGTLAGEASRGTLEVVLAVPVSRRSLALQKYLGHAVALGLAIGVVALLAWLGSVVFGTLPGDQMDPGMAFGEFALVAAISLLAGSIAFAVAPLLGSSLAAGVAGAYLYGSFAINGYSSLVPGFDVLRLGSVFYWTQGHRPMAGVADWPSVLLVLSLAALFALSGVLLFMRRDLASRAALPAGVRRNLGRFGLGRMSVGRWSLRGPGARSFAERLPQAFGWGAAMGLYGLFIALAADAFAEVINSVPQIAQMVRLFYPEFNFESVGGILQFAIFAFVALLVGIAAAALVHGWSSDEREGRLEMVLSTPIERTMWFLRSGAGMLLAIMVMGVMLGLGPAIGAAVQGDAWLQVLAGGLVLGLYAAALAGVGLLVGGAGWPKLAALAVGGLTLLFYLIDLLGQLLGLSPELLNISLTRHLGRPMAGTFDVPGLVACAALALGGLLLGAWRFGRRDLHAT